ncbi:MAG: hypothetical protein MI807_05465, partial [Verrucomicrobiales bacterium]|nr:hypothetical protein [Verrucomicrobiales bacterium]
ISHNFSQLVEIDEASGKDAVISDDDLPLNESRTKVFEKDDVYSTRGIPKSIRVTEIAEKTGKTAKLKQARIGYNLKE